MCRRQSRLRSPGSVPASAVAADDMYPSAPLTTIRGSLVAASQALYILGPEDLQLRRGRGLAAIHEMYRNLKNFYEGDRILPDLSTSEARSLEDQLVRIDRRMSQARAAGADSASFKLTEDVIPYAAGLVYGEEPAFSHAALRLWHQMSGDAHALGWPIMQRSTRSATAGRAAQRRNGTRIAGRYCGTIRALIPAAEKRVVALRSKVRGMLAGTEADPSNMLIHDRQGELQARQTSDIASGSRSQ